MDRTVPIEVQDPAQQMQRNCTSQKKKDVSNEANPRLNTQKHHNKSLVVMANNSNLSAVTAVTLVVVYSLLLFNVSVVIDT